MCKSSSRVAERGFLFLISLCLFVGCAAQTFGAESRARKIVCVAEMTAARRQALAESLRAITGWRGLHFDADGQLSFGDLHAEGGSPTARALLRAAQSGPHLIVIEDTSNRADVIFGRVSEARWKHESDARAAAFLVQIDFADFSHVRGDEEARAAFNAGWVLLHEISHVTQDATDTSRADEPGDCESLVNLMRRECELAVRAEYHFRPFPSQERGEFRTRYVRLAFEWADPATNKKRRLWLIWDAGLVGGVAEDGNCPPSARAAINSRPTSFAGLQRAPRL
jgi:hypothetical protein